MFSSNIKSLLGVFFDETVIAVASMISISHLFMTFWSNSCKNDMENQEDEKAKEELVGYRKLLEEKRELLNNVLQELNSFDEKINEMYEMLQNPTST